MFPATAYVELPNKANKSICENGQKVNHELGFVTNNGSRVLTRYNKIKIVIEAKSDFINDENNNAIEEYTIICNKIDNIAIKYIAIGFITTAVFPLKIVKIGRDETP